MEKLPHNADFSYPEQLPIDSFSTKEEIDKLIGIIRRQYPIMGFILACVIALSLVYLFTTPKQYTAHTMFLIDTTKIKNSVSVRQSKDFDEPLDDAQVETEIEVLKSEKIGLQVVKDLKLTEDPEFVGSQTSLIGAFINLITSPFSSGAVESPQAAESENALTRAALGHFLGNRSIKRVTTTYVLDISYTSPKPSTAAAVANSIADAYLVGQLDDKFQASTRVAKWLQDRIVELRQQAMTADLAVLQFKKDKNIVDSGGTTGDNGTRLLVDQQVADINAQLTKARADTAEAKARLDRIQIVMNEDIPDAAVTDSLNSGIISQLRTQYLDYARRYNLYASRYGPTHLAVINLQTQMTGLRQSMHDELNRIAESYKSNYEIAKAAEENLEKNLSRQIADSQLTNRERLGLAELEAKAKAYHAAHDGFIQRYMELTEQQSLPTTDARVITAATPPGGASSPNPSRVLLIASVLGLILSFGVAGLRESIDKVFRSTKQVEQLLKTNCLTALPVVKNNIITFASASEGTPNLPAKRLGLLKELDPKSGLYRHVIDEPLSSFAEGCRAVKVAADISGSIKKNKVIGITSSLPREGKSTVACNFAELVAHGGRKVILIDGDLRNPTLTNKLASKADIGLLEVLGGKAELREAIYTDSQSGLAFLPAVIESRLAHSSEIIASDVFRQLVDGLRKSYDYIIIDLPPLAPVVDARATAHIVDSYVFVIEWGRTTINMVQRQLSSAPEIFERLLGVVLNKANVKVLDRYEDYYGGSYYKNDYYSRYGYTK